MPVGDLINGNNIWTYNWTGPVVVKDGDYYVTGTQYGANNTGNWRVFETDGTTTNIDTLYGTLENDDHNNPSLAVQDGYDTIAFFTRHGASGKVNYCKSPSGTFNFGSKLSTTFSSGVTYSQPIFKGDDIYLFTRSPSTQWRFKKSTDWASTWGSEVVFIDSGTAGKFYCQFSKSETDPDIYHVGVWGHPNESTLTDIYYCKVNIDTGDISTSGGSIGNLDGTSLPLSLSSLDVAWTPTGTTNPRVRMLDVSEKRGNIVIAYAKWSDTDETNPNYLYSWSDDDGATWTDEFVVQSGGIFGSTLTRKYVGGIAFDRNSRNEFYVSRKDGSTWKIQRYVVNTDMSCTYDSTRDTSSYPLVRPICPVGGDGVFYCLLLDYTSYLNWESRTYWRA